MLQRTSGEHKIGFLDTDFEKLGKEVKAINEAKNHKPEKPTRLAKQTSGNIYKQRSLVNFLEEGNVPEPTTKAEETIQPIPAKKLDSNFDPQAMSFGGRAVRSARTGNIQDFGGPSGQIKSRTSNSIWDSEHLASLAKTPTRQEEVKQEEQEVRANRRDAEAQRMTELAERLKGVDQRKAADVAPAGMYSGSSFKAPKQNISIFDSEKDFNRIPEQSVGEKISSNAQKTAIDRADGEYIRQQKATTAKEIEDRFFDSLLKKD